MLALLIILVAVCFILDFLARTFIRRISTKIAVNSKTQFDDILIQNKLPRNVSHIIPVYFLIEYVDLVFVDYPRIETFVEKGAKIFGIILTLWIARSLLNSIKDYLKTKDKYRDKPYR